LIVGESPQFNVSGVWALKKADGPADWAVLKAVLQIGRYGVEGAPGALAMNSDLEVFSKDDLALSPPALATARLGPNFETLSPLSGLSKTPLALSVPASFGFGICAIAALGKLPPGAYELEIEVATTVISEQGEILAVGVVSGGRLLAVDVASAFLPSLSRMVLGIKVGEEGRGGISVLFKALGRADFSIVSLSLR
jgi:hypothetical protein